MFLTWTIYTIERFSWIVFNKQDHLLDSSTWTQRLQCWAACSYWRVFRDEKKKKRPRFNTFNMWTREFSSPRRSDHTCLALAHGRPYVNVHNRERANEAGSGVEPDMRRPQVSSNTRGSKKHSGRLWLIGRVALRPPASRRRARVSHKLSCWSSPKHEICLVSGSSKALRWSEVFSSAVWSSGRVCFSFCDRYCRRWRFGAALVFCECRFGAFLCVFTQSDWFV